MNPFWDGVNWWIIRATLLVMVFVGGLIFTGSGRSIAEYFRPAPVALVGGTPHTSVLVSQSELQELRDLGINPVSPDGPVVVQWVPIETEP